MIFWFLNQEIMFRSRARAGIVPDHELAADPQAMASSLTDRLAGCLIRGAAGAAAARCCPRWLGRSNANNAGNASPVGTPNSSPTGHGSAPLGSQDDKSRGDGRLSRPDL